MKLPVKLLDGLVGEEIFLVQLPFDIFHYLVNECKFQVGGKLVQDFWKHLENVGDNWGCSTTAFRNAQCGKVLPLGFYGDEACMAIQNNPLNKILGLTANCPLFRPRSTRLSRFLIFSIETEKIVSFEKTIFPVLEKIVESFNKLTEQGINGTRFVVSEIRGDQVFIRSLFGHVSFWKAVDVCFRCKATSRPGPLNYCIYESNDGWNQTIRDTEQFLLEELPRNAICYLTGLVFRGV